ncbi:MAG TPA: oligosaccharide flippase family protein [Rhodanobacteraceae bacterium]|nr:oligosaccharide flippase family protein [Rhodanobacteraceae bacterium]
MSTRAQAMRNTLFSSVGIYTEYFLGMLVSIIIARHLGPHDFGTYSLVVWFVAIGVTATNSGTSTAAIKFIAELRGSGRPELTGLLVKYLRRAQHVFLLVILVAGGIAFFLAGDRLAPDLNHLALFALLVFAISLRAPYMFNVSTAKGFEAFGSTATIALLATPLNLAMVIAAWALHAPVEGFLIVYAISSVAFYAVSQYQVHRLIPAAPPGATLPDDFKRRVHRHMRIVAFTVTISAFTATETEVLFLNLFATPASAGQFKVAFQLASGAALLVPGVFSAVLLPMMARALSEGREIAARRFVASATYLTLLASPLVGFGLVFSDPAILVLYGSAYAPAGPVLAACLFACSLSTIGQAATSLLVSADHQHSILRRVIAYGALKLVLDVVLIKLYGLTGAIIAYTSVVVFGLFLTLTLALKVSGARLAWGRLGRIGLALLIAAAAAYPLRHFGTPLLACVAGGLLLGVVYFALTILLGCWSRADIEYMKSVHRRVSAEKPRALASLLDWAGARAAKDYV